MLLNLKITLKQITDKQVIIISAFVVSPPNLYFHGYRHKKLQTSKKKTSSSHFPARTQKWRSVQCGSENFLNWQIFLPAYV